MLTRPFLTSTSKAVRLEPDREAWGGRGQREATGSTAPPFPCPDPGVTAGGHPPACAGARGEGQHVQRGPGQCAGAGRLLLLRGRAAGPVAPEVSRCRAPSVGLNHAHPPHPKASPQRSLAPQPAAALSHRGLRARLCQGHQGSGQVRGSQAAEHHGHQRRLHCGPAGEPRAHPCWQPSPVGGPGPHCHLPAGGTGHDIPRPWLPAPGTPRCRAPHWPRLLWLRLPQHPGQWSALPQSIPGASRGPSDGQLVPNSAQPSPRGSDLLQLGCQGLCGQREQVWGLGLVC